MRVCTTRPDWGEDSGAGAKARWDMRLVRRIYRYFRPYWRYYAGGVVFIAAGAVVGLAPALVTRSLLDYLTNHLNRPGGQVSHVLLLVGLGLMASLAGALTQAGENWCGSTISEGVIADLRQQLFARLLRQSVGFFTRSRTGQVMSRLVNDVEAIDDVIKGTLFDVLSNLLIALTTLGLMLVLNWQMTILTLVLLPAVIVPSRWVGNRTYQTRKRTQAQLGRLTEYLQEILGISGMLLVKAYSTQRLERERFHELNDGLRRLKLRQASIGRWFMALMGALQVAVPAILWLAGAWLILRREATVGTIIPFVVMLVSRLSVAIGALGSLHVNITGSIALFDRIFAYLDLDPEVEDQPDAKPVTHIQGDIRFENVTFSYEPTLRPAIQNLSFSASRGQLVALVGPTGAGKSTVTYLLARLYDPQQGRVLIDGRDLREIALDSLIPHMGIVFQDTFLFHASIRDNLKYARPEAADDELVAAAKAACLHDFIESLPTGYDTIVGERGYRLSGGEKQRLAVARVILRDPKFLILDEATSHLDSESEHLMQEALRTLFAGRTSVVIAHRLSTILAADLILVLDESRLAEQGTHETLLAQGGLYAKLYERQFATQQFAPAVNNEAYSEPPGDQPATTADKPGVKSAELVLNKSQELI